MKNSQFKTCVNGDVDVFWTGFVPLFRRWSRLLHMFSVNIVTSERACGGAPFIYLHFLYSLIVLGMWFNQTQLSWMVDTMIHILHFQSLPDFFDCSFNTANLWFNRNVPINTPTLAVWCHRHANTNYCTFLNQFAPAAFPPNNVVPCPFFSSHLFLFPVLSKTLFRIRLQLFRTGWHFACDQKVLQCLVRTDQRREGAAVFLCQYCYQGGSVNV